MWSLHVRPKLGCVFKQYCSLVSHSPLKEAFDLTRNFPEVWVVVCLAPWLLGKQPPASPSKSQLGLGSGTPAIRVRYQKWMDGDFYNQIFPPLGMMRFIIWCKLARLKCSNHNCYIPVSSNVWFTNRRLLPNSWLELPKIHTAVQSSTSEVMLGKSWYRHSRLRGKQIQQVKPSPRSPAEGWTFLAMFFYNRRCCRFSIEAQLWQYYGTAIV